LFYRHLSSLLEKTQRTVTAVPSLQYGIHHDSLVERKREERGEETERERERERE
jgi:hypothetical protein